MKVLTGPERFQSKILKSVTHLFTHQVGERPHLHLVYHHHQPQPLPPHHNDHSWYLGLRTPLATCLYPLLKVIYLWYPSPWPCRTPHSPCSCCLTRKFFAGWVLREASKPWGLGTHSGLISDFRLRTQACQYKVCIKYVDIIKEFLLQGFQSTEPVSFWSVTENIHSGFLSSFSSMDQFFSFAVTLKLGYKKWQVILYCQALVPIPVPLDPIPFKNQRIHPPHNF